jgi:hypothetical protein
MLKFVNRHVYAESLTRATTHSEISDQPVSEVLESTDHEGLRPSKASELPQSLAVGPLEIGILEGLQQIAMMTQSRIESCKARLQLSVRLQAPLCIHLASSVPKHNGHVRYWHYSILASHIRYFCLSGRIVVTFDMLQCRFFCACGKRHCDDVDIAIWYMQQFSPSTLRKHEYHDASSEDVDGIVDAMTIDTDLALDMTGGAADDSLLPNEGISCSVHYVALRTFCV